jgi:hypothetical protein
MNSADLKTMVESFLGSYGWLFLSALVVIAFKQGIQKIVSSLFIFFGRDYNMDDIIDIGGRPARIVRMGPFSTTFFVYRISDEGKVTGGFKWTVDNDRLKMLQLMKPLPLIDLTDLGYYRKDKEDKQCQHKED